MKVERYWCIRRVSLSNEKRKARVVLPRHAGVFRVWSISDKEAVYTSIESADMRLGNWSSIWGQTREQIGVPSLDRRFNIEGISTKRRWRVEVFIQYAAIRSAGRYKRTPKTNASS